MKLLRYLLSLVGGSIFSIATISNINTPVTLGKDFGNLAERADNIDLGDSVFKRKPVGGTPGEVVGSGSESTGNPRDLRSWRGSIQPPDRHGLWKLEILHVQAEVDLIEIQLRHSHDKPVAILKWDTILEDFPVPAHGHGFSFGLQDHNGEQMIFVPSDHRVHAQYRKVFPEHFLLLAPGETFKKTIDLREWFKVSEGGHYVISLVQGLHAIFGDDIDLTTIERYEVSALPFYLAADSKDFSFRPFPPLKPSKGLTRRATPCAGHWGEKVARARAGAKSLARFTRRNFDAQLWQEYFNGVRDVRKRVEGVYHEIEGYTDNVKINILELCDTTNSDSWCRSGMVAYHQRGAHLKIVFCDLFFSDETQADRTCEACGPYTDDNGVQQIRYDMCDAPGCFMHELTHVKELVKYEINDGFYGDCYGWKRVTYAAGSRYNPRFDGKEYPDIDLKSKDRNEDEPEKIASAYELYAYAIRAKACREQRWPEPSLSGRLQYCWTKLKNGCKICNRFSPERRAGDGCVVDWGCSPGAGHLRRW